MFAKRRHKKSSYEKQQEELKKELDKISPGKPTLLAKYGIEVEEKKEKKKKNSK